MVFREPDGPVGDQGLYSKADDLHLRSVDCALSQVRGPKSARIYSEMQKQLHPDSQQEVLVLRGGFTEFAQQYKVRLPRDIVSRPST